MHVLLVHQAFAALDEPGGTRHHELARHLAQRGHQVTVIASPISYLTGKSRRDRSAWVERQEDMPGVTILRAYAYPALHRSFFHRVIGFFSFMVSSFWVGLSVKEVDLVWGTSPPIFQGLTAWALSRIKGTRFLFEVRDLWPAFAVAVGVLRQPLLVRMSEWLEKFLYRRADELVVNSPGFIDHVQSCGARRVKLVPNGADVNMFDPEQSGESFRRQHGLGDRYVALYAGAHGMSNDLGVVLDAAQLLKDEAYIAIVLLGDGKEKPRLVQRAADLGLDNLHFVSSLPKNEMPAALAAADACIAILKPIELYKTVYPNKVFDYMAAGRPVILAVDGVIREVVETARAGVYVPPGDPTALADCIRMLAANRSVGVDMGRRGRMAVKQSFDRAVLAEQMEALMLEITES